MEAADVAPNWSKNDSAPQGADWYSINNWSLRRRLDAAACGDKIFSSLNMPKFAALHYGTRFASHIGRTNKVINANRVGKGAPLGYIGRNTLREAIPKQIIKIIKD